MALKAILFAHELERCLRRANKKAMRKIKLIVVCWLLLLQICVTNGIGQENVRLRKTPVM
jgi:hypothetical protein